MSGWYEKCPICSDDLSDGGDKSQGEHTEHLRCDECCMEFTLYFKPYLLAELGNDDGDNQYREWTEHSIIK